MRDRRIVSVGSSPSRRCIETIEPLADAVHLEISLEPSLAEGADVDDAWAVLVGLTAFGAVSVIGRIRGALRSRD